MEPTRVIDVVLTQTAPPEPAAPPVDLGLWSAITGAGLVEQLVLLLLLGFSVASWAIIAYKVATFRRAFRQSESFLDFFWGSKRLDAIYQKSESFAASPIAQVFRAGYVELAKLKKRKSENESDTDLDVLDSIERSMRRAQSSELTTLEALTPFLATVGSTSPFIGLFGTVVGIMTSFQDIGRMGSASLATVAPGVGGALVATAAGLLAAIPAVMAYNHLLTRIRVLDSEMQNFASDFLNIIKRHFF